MKNLSEDFTITLFDTAQSDAFFNLISKNRKRLEVFFAGTVSRTKTINETKVYCEDIKKRIEEKSYFSYIIRDKETDEFIGLIDVKNIDWNVPKAEMGYFIDSTYEGKGVISKALKFIIDYLAKNYEFKKLLCRVNSENVGSIKVAMKNGFELEGTIRSDYRTSNGEIVDLNYYGRVFE